MTRRLVAAAACLLACSHAPPAAEPLPAPPAQAPAPAAVGTVHGKKPRQPTAEEKAWFDTLKSAVGPQWTSRIATAVDANDPEGCRDFQVERRLVVEFVVNAEGLVTSSRVKESSGLPYIDRIGPETFTAVHRVAPPPRSLAGKKLPFEFNVNARPNPYACRR